MWKLDIIVKLAEMLAGCWVYKCTPSAPSLQWISQSRQPIVATETHMTVVWSDLEI